MSSFNPQILSNNGAVEESAADHQILESKKEYRTRMSERMSNNEHVGMSQ